MDWRGGGSVPVGLCSPGFWCEILTGFEIVNDIGRRLTGLVMFEVPRVKSGEFVKF